MGRVITGMLTGDDLQSVASIYNMRRRLATVAPIPSSRRLLRRRRAAAHTSPVVCSREFFDEPVLTGDESKLSSADEHGTKYQ